jgi:hypothetical protein
VAEPALTPDVALDYLGELSTDIDGAILLAAGETVAAAWGSAAGSPDRIAERTRELIHRVDAAAGGDPPAEFEVSTGPAAVFVVRDASWTLAVLAGRFALSSLMLYDMRKVVADLHGAST